MAWTVWMDPYDTIGSILDTTYFQPLKFPDNYLLEYMRAWVVFQNAPAFSNMVMKIYGNDENAANPTPTTLLATSTNSFDLADITTEAHGIKELWFKFDSFHVKQGGFYNFVINATGYSPTPTAFLGLEKAYPNPIQQIGYITSVINVPNSPYKFYPVGSRL